MIQIHTETINIQTDYVELFDSGILADDIVNPGSGQHSLSYFIPYTKITKIYFNSKKYYPARDTKDGKLYTIAPRSKGEN